jgi:hypothetical protein
VAVEQRDQTLTTYIAFCGYQLVDDGRLARKPCLRLQAECVSGAVNYGFGLLNVVLGSLPPTVVMLVGFVGLKVRLQSKASSCRSTRLTSLARLTRPTPCTAHTAHTPCTPHTPHTPHTPQTHRLADMAMFRWWPMSTTARGVQVRVGRTWRRLHARWSQWEVCKRPRCAVPPPLPTWSMLTLAAILTTKRRRAVLVVSSAIVALARTDAQTRDRMRLAPSTGLAWTDRWVGLARSNRAGLALSTGLD